MVSSLKPWKWLWWVFFLFFSLSSFLRCYLQLDLPVITRNTHFLTIVLFREWPVFNTLSMSVRPRWGSMSQLLTLLFSEMAYILTFAVISGMTYISHLMHETQNKTRSFTSHDPVTDLAVVVSNDLHIDLIIISGMTYISYFMHEGQDGVREMGRGERSCGYEATLNWANSFLIGRRSREPNHQLRREYNQGQPHDEKYVSVQNNRDLFWDIEENNEEAEILFICVYALKGMGRGWGFMFDINMTQL